MKSFIALLLLTGMAVAQDTATTGVSTTKPEITQALRGAVLLRDRMRDPDSFKIEKALTRTKKTASRLRASNIAQEMATEG